MTGGEQISTDIDSDENRHMRGSRIAEPTFSTLKFSTPVTEFWLDPAIALLDHSHAAQHQHRLSQSIANISLPTLFDFPGNSMRCTNVAV